MTDSVGQLIATGTQNYAALIGLFSTDSVELSASAIHRGFAPVVVSSLSLLGILGLVKGTLKISLGLERCRTAGFDLDSLRGIFGYGPGESALSGKIVECDAITVTITKEKDIIVHKTKRHFDDVRTPMVSVGWDWGMRHQTAVNLGNKKEEASKSLWIAFLFAAMCSGVTAWLVLVIKSPWTWVRIVATVGLQSSLMSMVLLPVWYDWQTARPWSHLTRHRWDLLNGSMTENSVFHILQARVVEGDVIHFQGDTSLLTSRLLRVSVFLVTMITSVAYICQYSIVKPATNKEAIIWVSCQAVAALVRIFFWIFGASVGGTSKGRSEAGYVLINNTVSDSITFAEFICACEIGETRVPWKYWEALEGTALVQLLEKAASTDAEEVISRTAPCHVFLNVDFKRILGNRLDHNQLGFGHDWRLGFWENTHAGRVVVPFVLVQIPYSEKVKTDWVDGKYCWMQATNSRSEGSEIRDPCTMFGISEDGDRLHLRPHKNCVNQRCSAHCIWDSETKIDRESPESSGFLHHRSGLLTEMRDLVQAGSICSRGTNGYGAHVWVRSVQGADARFRTLRYWNLRLGRNGIGDHIADSHQSVNWTDALRRLKCGFPNILQFPRRSLITSISGVSFLQRRDLECDEL